MKTRNEAVIVASSLWQFLMIRDQNLILDIQSYSDCIQLTAFFGIDEEPARHLYSTILALEMSLDSMWVEKIDSTGHHILNVKILFENN